MTKGLVFVAMVSFLLLSCKKKVIETIYTIKLQHLSAPSRDTYLSVCFINSTTGFISGTTGAVFSTSNSGNSWSNISLPDPYDVHKIYFLNPSVGYACSEGGIYTTSNGGKSWTQVFSETAIRDICFMKNNLSFAVGKGAGGAGSVFKSTDNWQTYTDLSPGYGATSMNAVCFLNKDTGYIAAYEQNLYKTTDGGNTWGFLAPGGSISNFTSLVFTSYDNGYVVGGPGTIDNETPGGPLLNQLGNYNYNINAIAMNNGKYVAVGAYSVIIPLNDPSSGNITWQYCLAPDGTTIAKTYNGVGFSDSGTFYAVGDSGTITRFTYPQ